MSWATIAAIGSLLGGAGGLASAFMPGQERSGNVRIEPWSRYTWGKSFDESRRRFDTVMDQTIQRRVADAKAAGIHPVFALGASPASTGAVPASMDFATSNVDDPYTLPQRIQGASSSMSRMARDMFDMDMQSKKLDLLSKEIDVQVKAAAAAKLGSVGTSGTDKVLTSPSASRTEIGPHSYAEDYSGPYGDSVSDTMGWLKFYEDYWSKPMREAKKARKLHRDVLKRGFWPEGARPGWKPSHMR